MSASVVPLLEEGTADKPGAVASTVYQSGLTAWGEVVKCLCCPFMCLSCGPMQVVRQGSVGVLTRFGVFSRVLPPGMYVLNPMAQSVEQVSVKMQTFLIPRQQAMTRDNIQVMVDAVAFVTVVDPRRACFEVEDYPRALENLAAITLLRIIGEHSMQEIFQDRGCINDKLTQTMKAKTTEWGLSMAGVELRDIKIPDAMQRTMAQIAEANREAESKVIVAEGQRKAASIFAEAAESMEKNPMSLQLQWFETLRQIAVEKNSTVIVPDSVIGTMSDISKAARTARQQPWIDVDSARASSDAGAAV